MRRLVLILYVVKWVQCWLCLGRVVQGEWGDGKTSINPSLVLGSIEVGDRRGQHQKSRGWRRECGSGEGQLERALGVRKRTLSRVEV